MRRPHSRLSLFERKGRRIDGQYGHTSFPSSCSSLSPKRKLSAKIELIISLTPSQSGSNTDPGKNSPSLSQFLATLIPVGLVAAVYVVIFLVLRRRLKRNYSPRTYLGSLRPQSVPSYPTADFRIACTDIFVNRERTPDLPGGLFNWIGTFNKIPDSYVLNHHSLDAFLFLRYLKISVALCFFGCLITWPVLFPVNATGGGTQKQMNLISFSNVVNTKNRYYAHTGVAWIYFCECCNTLQSRKG